MRTLTSTLQEAQEYIRGPTLYKVVLTDGVDTYTYEQEGDNAIIYMSRIETIDSQKLEVTLDNSDNTLTDLDLRGFAATVSYGYTTSGGDEYSSVAPYVVIFQDFFSASQSEQGVLTCKLSLVGYPNLVAADKASEDWENPNSSGATVKDLLNQVLAGNTDTYTITESQLEGGGWQHMRSPVVHGLGQRLIINGRTVETLSFKLRKHGLPTGDVTFYIRDSAEWTELFSGVWGDASALSQAGQWCDIDVNETITDEVFIYAEHTGGTTSDYVQAAYSGSNVKNYENLFVLSGIEGPIDYENSDMIYKYTYEGEALPCFDHCDSYTISYDSEDDLIDSFCPGDAFKVALGESRWAKVKELLAYTNCVGRWENDGYFHVFVPVTTGDIFDYQYSREELTFLKA